MLTPGQTIGPFFGHALPWPDGPYVVDAARADGFWLRGRVLDGDGAPVPDAMVETYQVGPPDCRRFGRCPTDQDGGYAIRTVAPPPVPGGDGTPQAPHLAVVVFARGLLHRLVTRIYFPDQATANATDPVLGQVAAQAGTAARDTLVAQPAADGYGFDIRLQGRHETVFFAV